MTVKGKDRTSIIVVAAILAVVFWLVKRQLDKAQAAGLLPGAIYPTTESEYEKLHRVVPITKHIEVEIPVYRTIEEWEANHV